jgi:hypothetical protein
MKNLLASILLTGISIGATAQVSPITVDYNRTESGVEISARNQSDSPQIVMVNLTVLENLSSPYGSSIITTVYPNSTTSICKLSPINKEQSTNFNYTTQYIAGTTEVKFDPNAIYLLPVRPSSSTRVGTVTSVEKYIKKEATDKVLGYSFETEQNDTIYATRKGIVWDIDDSKEDYGGEFFKSAQNKLYIYHKDGTIAQYTRIKQHSALVKNGDKVEAGQPIALAYNKQEDMATFLVIYSYYDKNKSKEAAGTLQFTQYFPKFLVNDNKLTELTPTESYTSMHPTAVITLEMTKREKKKYLEKKGIKE